MKFALFYEIPVARPWDEESEHRAYKDTITQALAAEDAHRLRRAPDASAVQPPGAHGRVGGGARPHLRRSGRLRDGPLVDPPRDRGFRHRPPPDEGDVEGSHRARGRVLDQRRVRVRRNVLVDAAAAGPAQAAPEATPAAV